VGVAVGDAIRRGEVYLVELEPVRGHEIRKTRPCLIISPDELNADWQTVIVAPMTTGGHPYPFRVSCRFANRRGHIILDQLRSVDRERLRRRLGRLSPAVVSHALVVLQEMFAT
jgi:mRNA interferase MazF